MINVQVEKTGAENNASLIRRFTKKVQASGIIQRVRRKRYSGRNLSDYNKKKMALKSLRNKERIAELIKLGKMAELRKR